MAGSAVRGLAVVALSAWAVAQEAAPPPRENRLAREQSPYLREHAHDPVDWHPWGDEAFARARKEGRPVFLSIGYSACHWCHVMQRESFQDPEIAAILNRATIPVKVDREERPDVDRIYIEACQRLSREGCGWPLTVFLTPDRKPFFAGTYFPPEDRGTRRGFKALVLEVETLWKERRAEVESSATRILDMLRGAHAAAPPGSAPPADLVAAAAASLRDREDAAHGGFGTAPKFPSPSGPFLLLRHAARSGDAASAAPVRRLLDALLRGGIRDHLAGGFHRYSTDADWKIPHFEKMLYDQALLAQLFLEGAQVFDDARYRDAVREILGFCVRDLGTPDGGFIAALDADTGGVEGKTYTWTLAELKAALSGDELRAVTAWCGATAEGNWEEGRNILFAFREPEAAAAEAGVAVRRFRGLLASAQANLLAARAARPQPRPDTKVLTGWNALLISSLARAGAALPEPRFIERAREAAALVERKLTLEDGSLLRSYAEGKARHPGELSDHAALLVAWLDLHEATLEGGWLDRARKLAAVIEKRFGRADGRFVDSAAPDVLYETQDLFDGAWPSGFSLAALGFARLGIVAGEPGFSARAEAALRRAGASLERQPEATCHALVALDLLRAPAQRVTFHGPRAAPELAALVAVVRGGYRPFTFPTRAPGVEEGQPRAIVCVGATCLEPATTPEELRERLAAATR